MITNSADENAVIITGTVVGVPRRGTTSGGRAFATVLVESRNSWVDRAGKTGKRVARIEVTVWGMRRLPCEGARVRVEGYLISRPYIDRRTGEERTAGSLTADRIFPIDDPEYRRQRAEDGSASNAELQPSRTP